MIDSLKRFFGKSSDRTLDKKKTTLHDTRIATCALLLEMATIDGEFNASEKEGIISILKDLITPFIKKSKITNYKNQIPNKSQISIFNNPNFLKQDIVWDFEFGSLVIICNL